LEKKEEHRSFKTQTSERRGGQSGTRKWWLYSPMNKGKIVKPGKRKEG